MLVSTQSLSIAGGVRLPFVGGTKETTWPSLAFNLLKTPIHHGSFITYHISPLTFLCIRQLMFSNVALPREMG